ncbi:MAG TPA: hypothetical protein DCL42_12235 [Deltaproteobacteria bacterium]|nr:MAG: hypothetical protein A2090_01715 [Deltaproteobacteria bacterium GWD2_42_10]OGP46437.1 MAG: hypothetical protein A2022_06620 [Deltaproteobacteria bacterium GWF2_42_12]OGQ75747.1 MAG: hypothetical protein A2235_09240 [Deltaproteobacteria bacterium RIFOXYA2_FULL_42_10]HAG52087.1 hypothetical protein [Deltaproteobacteria bacterium]
MLESEINKIKNLLANDERIVFAYIFGSRAKGIAGGRSDWDIAIYAADKGRQTIPATFPFYIEAEIAALLATNDVQVVVLNGLESPLLGFEIIKDGILLVDKDEGKRIEFEARVLGQYHDWQYFLKRHMEAEGWA